MKTFMSRLTLAGIIGLSCFSSASAHISLETGEAAAGSAYKAVLRVAHGCNGKATTEIKVKIPEGFFNVKPMPHAGWKLDTVTHAYANAYTDHGASVASGVTQVIWSGGHLSDAHYDEFVMRGSLSPDLAPDTVLHFPAIQACADGSENHWVGTAEFDAPMTAPTLKVTAASNHHETYHGGHHEKQNDMATNGGALMVGDIDVSGAFARATLPGAPVGGGFLTITNEGNTDDRLIAASSDAAGVLQLHNMRMDGEVMRMYQMPDGIPVPAHETVQLAPGGMHIMFMNLNGPLKEGTIVDVELTFKKAGSVTVPFHVQNFAAKSMDHGDMKHEMKSHDSH